MHRMVVPILALGLAMPAQATFELKDPAAEMLEADKAQSAEAIAARACFDFLLDSVERPEVYRAAVAWVRDTAAQLRGGAMTVTESALRGYCVDYPKRSLAEAAATLAATGADG
jgi:hypothetical protein